MMLPFQGVFSVIDHSLGGAQGWEMLPFQGEAFRVLK